MILPDANLLLYANNEDSELYAKSARWWQGCLAGNEPVVLCVPVLLAFLRIATNGRIFKTPATVEKASTRINGWLDEPIVHFAETTRQDFQMTLDLLGNIGTGGNFTTDAQIAAIALRLGATIHTHDTDFARFPLVRWLNPLQAPRGR